jgi:hypothetical protein
MDDDTRTHLEINKYKKFKKVDGATYRKVNQFLRKRTYITAREWALARLCTDFRTSGGAEMTFIGQHLPELVPFMEDTYSPQAVNQARNSFKKKVRKASATFFYGAMCGFFTTDELDDLLFEASEVSRFLLEVEGTTLDIDEEIDIEDRITTVMRGVGEAAKTILKARGEEIDPATAAHNDPSEKHEPEITEPRGIHNTALQENTMIVENKGPGKVSDNKIQKNANILEESDEPSESNLPRDELTIHLQNTGAPASTPISDADSPDKSADTDHIGDYSQTPIPSMQSQPSSKNQDRGEPS